MERIEPETNKRRYYLVTWARTLWSEMPDRANTWTVWRQWGRIDQSVRGTRIEECGTEEEALRRAAETIDLRMRHKYVIKSSNPKATESTVVGQRGPQSGQQEGKS